MDSNFLIFSERLFFVFVTIHNHVRFCGYTYDQWCQRAHVLGLANLFIKRVVVHITIRIEKRYIN